MEFNKIKLTEFDGFNYGEFTLIKSQTGLKIWKKEVKIK